MGCGSSAKERSPETAAVVPQVDLKTVREAGAHESHEASEKPWQEAEPDPSAAKVSQMEPAKAQQDKPAVGVEPSVQPWHGAQPGAAEATPKEWQRPATWPAPKEVSPPGPDAPHVVLSTKFEEPWGTISRGLKEILVEKGCTVYNPNTDNKEPGHA